MTDIVADAEKQGANRWFAMLRKLNGDTLWIGDRVHPSKRSALIEAIARRDGQS